MKDSERAKQAAGQLAATWIQDGMIVGLGTGSTAIAFIEALAERCRKGLNVVCAATSIRSTRLATDLGLAVVELNSLVTLDITVDGADEITPKKEMIKGGGGALLREKVLASLSREMVVVVDESKCVPTLGTFKLPIEVIPFAYRPLQSRLEKMGYPSKLRLNENLTPYFTDNNNYILDLTSQNGFPNLEEADAQLRSIPGVLETGLFLNLAGRVIVGKRDGTTTIWE